jgi:hypothetical protein
MPVQPCSFPFLFNETATGLWKGPRFLSFVLVKTSIFKRDTFLSESFRSTACTNPHTL